MSKNGAGYDPDIEDVPGDLGYDEDDHTIEEVENEDDISRMLHGDDEDELFVPEEENL